MTDSKIGGKNAANQNTYKYFTYCTNCIKKVKENEKCKFRFTRKYMCKIIKKLQTNPKTLYKRLCCIPF